MTEKNREAEQPSYNYHVVVAGTGAVYEEKTQKALGILGPQEKRILLDSSYSRISSTQNPNRLQADADNAPFDLRGLPKEKR